MELMKEDSLTSEEKLLRLIRKKDKAANPPLPFQENNAPTSAETPGQMSKPLKTIDSLTFSIRALAVTAAGLFIFILLKYLPAKAPVPTPSGAAPTGTAESSVSEAPVAFEIRPFDSYKQTLESRDMFQAPWEKPAAATPSATASAAELTKQLRLVGIVLDRDPKAVVEDLATQQTFFVSPGEQIGNATVAEIREDKVILIFGQERVELVP